MKLTAIIAEYNPFTNGHAYQAEAARRETQADALIAVMSGSFTQRGDCAVADKYLRAAAAVKCGVDMVIELPTIYAVSTAEQFAYGAVKMLSGIKEVECISFGSECGDVSILTRAADLAANEPSEMSQAVKNHLDDGASYPKAFSKAFDEYCAAHAEYADLAGVYEGANNTLAIAYITAAKRLSYKVAFHTVKRVGAGYDDEDESNETPSASAIRKALFEGKLPQIKKSMPTETYELLCTYRGSAEALGDMILYKLKQVSGYDLIYYHGFDQKDGLNNRIKIAADTSSTYKQFLEKAKTKKYTLARIKRLAIGVLLNMKEDFFQNALYLPDYYNVLAIKKERSAELLSTLSYLKNLMLKFSDADKKLDKTLRPLAKLDWEAQGVLSVINRDTQYNRVMLSIE